MLEAPHTPRRAVRTPASIGVDSQGQTGRPGARLRASPRTRSLQVWPFRATRDLTVAYSGATELRTTDQK